MVATESRGVDGVSISVTNTKVQSSASGLRSGMGQKVIGGWLKDRRRNSPHRVCDYCPAGGPVSPDGKGWDDLVDKSYIKR